MNRRNKNSSWEQKQNDNFLLLSLLACWVHTEWHVHV